MIPLFPANEGTLGCEGPDERRGSLFSYVDLEDRVPAKYPLRVIRCIVNDALAAVLWHFFFNRCNAMIQF